jgi:hypothetical protein
VLGHSISRKGIEVDKAKIDIISKLAPPIGCTKFRYSQLHEPLVCIAFAQVPRSNHKEPCIVYTKLTLSLGQCYFNLAPLWVIGDNENVN